jgi:hypothetical protein
MTSYLIICCLSIIFGKNSKFFKATSTGFCKLSQQLQVWKTSFGKIKKGGNYRENQVLQTDSKGSGHYLWESMIK